MVLPWQVVCLPVTLSYRDHIGWNSSKIISQLIIMAFPLSADPNITDLLVLQWEHPQILAGTGVGMGYGKIGCGHTKLAISVKRLKIKRRLLFVTVGQLVYLMFRVS